MRTFALAVLMCALATALRAQNPTRPDSAREPAFSPGDTVAAALSSSRLTPGRAFVRSLLVPGWGQFSQGAKKRGIIYASLQGASFFMLAKTQIKIGDARDQVSSLHALAVDSLRSDAVLRRDTALIRRYSDPDTVGLRADSTAAVLNKSELVESRRSQREDWIAQSIFFTLASAVDAYVGAHLSDFPGTVSAQPMQRGRMRFDWTIPLAELRRRPNGGRW